MPYLKWNFKNPYTYIYIYIWKAVSENPHTSIFKNQFLKNLYTLTFKMKWIQQFKNIKRKSNCRYTTTSHGWLLHGSPQMQGRGRDRLRPLAQQLQRPCYTSPWRQISMADQWNGKEWGGSLCQWHSNDPKSQMDYPGIEPRPSP
jgi:hypothetical protein